MSPVSTIMAGASRANRYLVPVLLTSIPGLGIGVLVAQQRYLAVTALSMAIPALLLVSRLMRTTSPGNSGLPETWYGVVAVAPSSRLLRRWIFFGVGLMLLVFLLNLYAPASPTVAQRVLASLIVLLAAVPTWLWISGRAHGVPFLLLFSSIYALYYAVPVFLLEKYTRGFYFSTPIPSPSLDKSLLLALGGVAFLLFGYYGPFQRNVARFLPAIHMQWRDLGAAKILGMILGSVGVVVYYYMNFVLAVPVAIRQLGNALAELSIVCIALLYGLQLVGRLGFFGKCFLWIGLVPVRLLIGLATGLTAQGVMVVFSLILMFGTLRRGIPWKAVMAAGILIVLSRPIQTSFRVLAVSDGGAVTISGVEKVTAYVDTAKDVLLSEAVASSESVQMAVWRFAPLMTLAEVVELTPASVPYWRGATYYSLLLKPIPRFIYPGKPLDDTGQSFGHRYGFLEPDDLATSYNLPQLVELYANFGVTGVMVGMCVIGVIYRIVHRMFTHPGMGFGAVVGSVYIFVNLLNMETGAGLVFGGLIGQGIFLVLFHGLICLVERQQLRGSE